MPTAEPTADCSYSQLARIVDENCEPFKTVAQAERFIKAASTLRRREPSEAEEDGVRVSKRDLLDQITEARKALGVLQLTSRPATVIVPTDCLR